MPFVDRKTHRIHYAVSGRDDAPPVLLVMGLALSSRAWDTLPARLAEHFRVVVLDNRGTGHSSLPKRWFRVADMADDAAAVLADAGIARANVLGISMGGMIAIELALRHPDRVARLALGCTHGGYLRSHKPTFATTRKLLGGGLLGGRVDFGRAASFLVSDDYYAKNPDAFVSWMKKTDHAKPRAVLMQLFAILRFAADAHLSRIAAPTLIITGADDRLVPPANSHRLKKAIPGARLAVLEGAGHCFPVEKEAETSDLVTRFFSGEELPLGAELTPSTMQEGRV